MILTASGGPFYRRDKKNDYSLKEAIQHPTYHCGKKVAINCSTMMNKGLEVIAAKHFFDLCFDQIDVVIHPQSIVQGMIKFTDGGC